MNALRFSANLGMLFNEHSFLDRFEAARRAGFAGVEFPFPYDYPLEELVRAKRETGLEVVLINLPAGDWSTGDRGLASDPERITEFRNSVPRALEVARALDCPRVNCLSGVVRGAAPALAWQTFENNLEFAAREFADRDLDLLVEFINDRDMPGFLLTRWDAGIALIEKLNLPHLKLQFDLYHAQTMHGSVLPGIERCFSRIGHFQVADHPGRHEPGTGNIDFDAAFAEIARRPYTGWIGCEYHPTGATADTLGWLNRYRT
jgi:hydroxypyruvate isomerase